MINDGFHRAGGERGIHRPRGNVWRAAPGVPVERGMRGRRVAPPMHGSVAVGGSWLARSIGFQRLGTKPPHAHLFQLFQLPGEEHDGVLGGAAKPSGGSGRALTNTVGTFAELFL